MRNCVYKFINKSNKVIYIGKARDLRNRLSTHNHLPRECYDEVFKIEYTECVTEDDSLLLERYLIAKIKPKFNTIYRYNSLSINIKEFDYRIWKEINQENELYEVDDKNELEKKKINGKYEYSDDKRINTFLANDYLININSQYEKLKKIREEKYKLAEQKRSTMNRKDRELALRELIRKKEKLIRKNN